MTSIVLAMGAGLGMHLLWTATAIDEADMRAQPTRLGPLGPSRSRRTTVAEWLTQAGLGGVDVREFTGVVIAVAALGGLIGFVLFGGVVPGLVIALSGASLLVGSYRHRRRENRRRAQEAWPRMIEEIRVQTGSAGRSIPQALFHVGRQAPEELRPAFEAAQREWLLSTDLARALAVLKSDLADPTADLACETLLVAHELGGADLDQRLEALAEDRLNEVQSRKDATSRQAGARFARMFVLLVPAGMALAGLSVGNGRSAYRTPSGQLAVVLALLMIAACWTWAGRVMRIPESERVFRQ